MTFINYRSFRNWHDYLKEEISNQRLSKSVFRPVNHYLHHVPYVIRKLGPMRSYSTRPLERTIGKYSKLIKSRVESGVNASNQIERLSVRGYINTAMDLNEELDVIQTRPCRESDFIDSPSEDAGSHQLWAPFIENLDLQSDSNDNFARFGVPVSNSAILNALTRYYARSSSGSTIEIDDATITVAGRAWIHSTTYSSVFNKKVINEYRRGNNYIMFESNVLK